MPRMKNCAVCGQAFAAKSPNGKYCPTCRAGAYKTVQADAEKRLRESRKAGNPTPRMATYDDEDQIRACLNCRRADCPGWCEATGRPI